MVDVWGRIIGGLDLGERTAAGIKRADIGCSPFFQLACARQAGCLYSNLFPYRASDRGWVDVSYSRAVPCVKARLFPYLGMFFP